MNPKQRFLSTWFVQVPRQTAGNLVVALCALPLLVLLERTVGLELSLMGRIVLRWLVVVTVLGVAVGLEMRSLTELGFRKPAGMDLVYLLGATAAAFLVFVGLDPLITAFGLPVSEDTGVIATGAGIELALLAAITVGVVEEVLYRGYAIEQLIHYSGSPVIAGGISWGAFTLAHAFVWPVGNLVQIAVVSAVFTAIYLRRRSLFPVVGSHALVWCLAVMGQVYG